MDRRVEPVRVGGKRKRGDQLARETLLGLERELAVEAGVVDGVGVLSNRRHEWADAVPELGQNGLDLTGGHPGLEVIEQRVVRVFEALEALEAVRVAAPKLDVSLEERKEGGEVI